MRANGKLDRRAAGEMERFLRERQASLRDSLRATMARRRAHEAPRTGDEAARATQTLEDEIQIALVDRQSRQVAQIDAALERLAHGEYGLCHDCSEFIGSPRLRALPFAQRCSPCQAMAEGAAALPGSRLRKAA